MRKYYSKKDIPPPVQEDFYRDKKDIKRWLEQMGITNYYIRDNGKVDCPGNVFISSHQLKRIPIKFGVVGGYFDCSLNELTTLNGAPDEVKAEFYCEYNNLTNLYGGPKYVGGDYICYKNNLILLNGAPEYVGGDFDCCKNNDLSNGYLNNFDFSFVKGRVKIKEPKS